MAKFTLIILSFSLFLWACQTSTSSENVVGNKAPIDSINTLDKSTQQDSSEALIKENKPIKVAQLPEAVDAWVDLGDSAPSILQDIRYATDNNFLKQQIYDCGKCWMRAEAAKALMGVQRELQKKNKGLLVFDCYRPRPMQKRLWEVMPDPRYVSPPSKGSNHTRGLAVDLTIVDSLGKALDMGTDFDFFGKEAWHTNTQLSENILENRKLLKGTMETNGFKSIRTEWWHYSFLTKTKHTLADTLWACP